MVVVEFNENYDAEKCRTASRSLAWYTAVW